MARRRVVIERVRRPTRSTVNATLRWAHSQTLSVHVLRFHESAAHTRRMTEHHQRERVILLHFEGHMPTTFCEKWSCGFCIATADTTAPPEQALRVYHRSSVHIQL